MLASASTRRPRLAFDGLSCPTSASSHGVATTSHLGFSLDKRVGIRYITLCIGSLYIVCLY